MTCTDESVVPLEALSLHAILRFRPPPLVIAVDYMLVIAATEGHLLSRAAVMDLYKSRHCDLRAAITELNFWCQMAIGAPRAGVDWYLARWPPGRGQTADGQRLRVTSIQSFQSNTNVFPASDLRDEDILREKWIDFGIDPCFLSSQTLALPPDAVDAGLTPRDQYAFLAEYDKCIDMLSAVDVSTRVDLPRNCEVSPYISNTTADLAHAQIAT